MKIAQREHFVVVPPGGPRAGQDKPGASELAVVFVTVYSGVTLNADLATGVFDRFRSMPGWLRGVSDVNPVSHLVTAIRALMAGTPATPQVLWTAAAAGLLIAVFAPLTALLYQRK